MTQKQLLDQDTYSRSTKDYTGGLCPKCHDEFNLVEPCGEPQLDYHNKLMFILMACDCGTTFVQKLKNVLKYDRKTKKEKLSFEVYGYSHLCECEKISIVCNCEKIHENTYGEEYEIYLAYKMMEAK
tara:strand:- start:10858 stop:11238 length:381 start_codon:yes stop_codon:yes gene_type:complete